MAATQSAIPALSSVLSALRSLPPREPHREIAVHHIRHPTRFAFGKPRDLHELLAVARDEREREVAQLARHIDLLGVAGPSRDVLVQLDAIQGRHRIAPGYAEAEEADA